MREHRGPCVRCGQGVDLQGLGQGHGVEVARIDPRGLHALRLGGVARPQAHRVRGAAGRGAGGVDGQRRSPGASPDEINFHSIK